MEPKYYHSFKEVLASKRGKYERYEPVEVKETKKETKKKTGKKAGKKASE